MTRRITPPRDAERERAARLARWTRPRDGAPRDPDAPHVGDPDGPRLLRCGARPPGFGTDPVPEGDLVAGDGRWRERPAMAAVLDDLRRERDRPT